VSLYISNRFLQPLAYAQGVSERADWLYQEGRWIVVAAAAAAPTFVALATGTKAGGWQTAWKAIAIFLSLLAALVGARLASRRAIGVARVFGAYSRDLEQIGWKFVSAMPVPPDDPADDFKRFRDEVEGAVMRFNARLDADLIKPDDGHPSTGSA
jgi:hypothetical protein